MPELYTDDPSLFRLMREELFTAVVGDVMDKMGLQHQFLPPYLKPLRDDMIVAGRAMTVLEADWFEEANASGQSAIAAKPFGLMMHALDDLKAGEVYVASGSSPRFALWGEMMATRAAQLGAVGAVLDGYSRDTRGILKQGFPTVSRGGYAQDQGARGKVVDWRVPIEIGGVRVKTGDLVFGDLDGTLIVPSEAVEEAIARAVEKVRGENKVAQALQNGMSAVEAFETFGIM
ncbi:MAG: RraA family protein [Rhodospirillales bacterium]|nr:RraA family protein [Rhodospirillales bacterium]